MTGSDNLGIKSSGCLSLKPLPFSAHAPWFWHIYLLPLVYEQKHFYMVPGLTSLKP